MRMISIAGLIGLLLLLPIYGITPRMEADEDLARRVDEYMSRMTEAGFTGSLLVAKNGEIILSKGYGMADPDRGIPATDETVFTIGSITKQFTGAAVLKLWMMGKVGLQDPITEYFEDVPDDKKGITIHHLLTHTAGFRGAVGDDRDPIGRESFLKLAMESKLNREPGTLYEYSNVGYSLLGIIIELVSGRGYESFLHEHLFKPAGMNKTGYLIPDWKDEDFAVGYRGGERWGTIRDFPWADDGPGWHLRANGGILSTVTDMYRWHLALEGDEVLSREAKRLFQTPHVPEGQGADSHYGYGWAVSTTPRNTRLVAHNGGNMVFAADFLRFVDEDVVIFAASNTAEIKAFRVSDVVSRIVFGEPYSLPLPEAITMDEEALRRDPMGRHALALVASIGRNEKTTKRFIEEHMDPGLVERRGERIERFLRQKEGELGKVAFVEASKTEERTIVMRVRSEKSGRWWKLTVQCAEASPHRIVSIFVDRAMPPPGSADTAAGDWGLPQSSTGQRSAALLNALKQQDDGIIRETVQRNFAPDFLDAFSMEEHLEQFRHLRELLGNFELTGAMKTGPYSCRLTLLATDSKKTYRIELDLEPAEPYRIVGLSFEEAE